MAVLEMEYDGSHGITIGDKHTWRDFRMAPSSRPHVEAPGVKTEYVDIPGAHGSLDFTEILNGIKYQNRVGSWEFFLEPEATVTNWASVYSEILACIHGRQCQIVLDDDPNYYYFGRVNVNKWKSDQQYSTITLDYNLEPFKYPVGSTGSADWKWDELFSNTILYGTFIVESEKARNLINNTDMDVQVSITCSSAVQVKPQKGAQVSLPAGTTPNALTLSPGDNYMTFAGNAEVTIDYDSGRIL